MNHRRKRGPSYSPSRFNLLELLLLLTCMAITFALISRGVILLGFTFLATAIAFRTAIFDFTVLGGFATLATLFFGVWSIALLVVWSASW